MDLVKFGLGMIPGVGQAVQMTAGGGNVPGMGNAFGSGFTATEGPVGMSDNMGGGPPGVRLNKPVFVQNPIFLSNDVRGVAEKFSQEAERRMR